MMSYAMTCVALSLAGATGPGETRPAIEMKPMAITVDGPLEKETQRSCVFRRKGGGAMNVLSVAASDPAVGVDLREGSVPGIYVVTATLPIGYETKSARPVEVLVRTDLAAEPLIHIPVRVWSDPRPRGPGWLSEAKRLIGKPVPTTVLERLGGGQLEIGPVQDKITILVFSAHYCGHCDIHVPILERIWKEYEERGVQFLGVAAVGVTQDIESAVARWDLDWPLGLDRDWHTVLQFGVRAFPVVFVLGYDGTVEAVHGRSSNHLTGNGLDDLDSQLRNELDVLLTGRTRADFPNWEQLAQKPVTTRPVTTRPAGPVLKLTGDTPGAKCKPGESAVVTVPIRNQGSQALKLLKVTPADGVSVTPGYVKEVLPGGLALLRCKVTAPAQAGTFSRRIEIHSDDPKSPVALITLAGSVIDR
jgi:thiol-disulfide isomerase/thioredoxin